MIRLFFVAVGAGALMGCPYRGVRDPEPPTALPATYSNGDEEVAPPNQARLGSPQAGWWTSFGDPGLNALVDRALDENLDLAQAWARLEQARAAAREAHAALYPQVTAEGQVSRSQSLNVAFAAETKATVASVSLPVTYELDLFGQRWLEGRALDKEVKASRDAIEAAAITLTAEIAETWYALVEARAERELLEGQLELNETFLELVMLRFKQGLTAALDVYQQKRQVVARRADLTLVEARERALVHQLALLSGETPGAKGAIPSGKELPEVPPPPAAGIPADLLSNRPDLRAARHRVEAADRRAGAAIALHLPTIRLQAKPGYDFLKVTSPDFTMPMDTVSRDVSGFVWSVGASVSVPLFDGFQRSAEISRRRAVVAERLAEYGQTLRRALAEVQTALVQEQQQEAYITELTAQLEVTGSTLEAARDRYRQGLSDYLPVLTALEAQQRAELALLAARRGRISYRIQLHRALGGSWPKSLDAPKKGT